MSGPADDNYRLRYADRWLDRFFSELPAVMLVGPRAAGKTTTALRRAASVVSLDEPGQAAAFAASPDVALSGYEEPILLDEWQVVPDVLGAVKRAIDADSSPGRFIVTGSVRGPQMAPTWPGTGRLTRFTVHPMTVSERLGRLDRPTLLEKLIEGDSITRPGPPEDMRGYVEMALQSGFPQPALNFDEAGREEWMASYVEDLIGRDIPALERESRGRDRALLRRYFEAYALNSAGSPADSTIFEAAGVNRKTAGAYEALLEGVSVVERVPAWRTNRLRRLVAQPKRYVVDPALLAAVSGLSRDDVLRDGDLIGRVLDTFVAAQIRAAPPLLPGRSRMYHLRTQGGAHEVDLIVEIPGKGIVGIEVKATAAPSRRDARHLLWLRDEIGDDFISGVVLHTGPNVFELDHSIVAAPIAALWG